MIFEHDANLSLISQISDESVPQQGVSSGSMQMVLDQTTINKGQETLRPVKDRKRQTKKEGEGKGVQIMLAFNRLRML